MPTHLLKTSFTNDNFTFDNDQIEINDETIARGLERLQGDNKLDARQLKNLPSGTSAGSPILSTLATDLSSTTVSATSGWTALTNPYQHTLTRLAAAFWSENRRLVGNQNFFEDRDDVEVTGFSFSNTRFFTDGGDSLNTAWSGRSSYVINDSVRIKDKDVNTGTTTIPDDHYKVIGLEYQMESLPPAGEVYNILRFGDDTNEPLLAIDDGGLVVRVGNQDGSSVSQNRNRVLRTNGGSSTEHLGRVGNVDSSEDANFIVPFDVGTDQFPLLVRLRLEILHNGTSVGSTIQTFTISDRNTDQSSSTVTFSVSGQPDFVAEVSYDHQSTLYGVLDPKEILTIHPTALFTDNNIVYVFSASYTEQVTFTRSLTFTDHRINAGLTGSLRGSTGFPPNQYPTDQVHHTNDLLLTFVPTDPGHFTGDPPLTLFIVVNGIIEDAVPLHRTESEFDFSDMTFGNEHTDVARLQVYQYSADGLSTRINDTTLLQMYNSRNRWLGAFTRDTEDVDYYTLNADLEIQDTLYLNSSTNERFAVTVASDGALSTTAAPES